MELYGVVLSVPGFFVLGSVYSLILKWLIAPHARLSKLFLWGGVAVLFLWAVELIAVTNVGPTELAAALGPSFIVVHTVLLTLSVPSLANLIRLQDILPRVARWYVAGPCCGLFAPVVILLQIHVAESLYGIH